MIDGTGTPIGSALRLEGLPPPRALTAASNHVLIVCADRLHVFDPESGREVQALGLGEGVERRALLAGGRGFAAVAGPHVAWAVLPVPQRRRTRELLARGEATAALVLAAEAAAAGEVWAQEAHAEAGLLLLHGGWTYGFLNMLSSFFLYVLLCFLSAFSFSCFLQFKT
jgi:hypothetical protein